MHMRCVFVFEHTVALKVGHNWLMLTVYVGGADLNISSDWVEA